MARTRLKAEPLALTQEGKPYAGPKSKLTFMDFTMDAKPGKVVVTAAYGAEGLEYTLIFPPGEQCFLLHAQGEELKALARIGGGATRATAFTEDNGTFDRLGIEKAQLWKTLEARAKIVKFAEAFKGSG